MLSSIIICVVLLLAVWLLWRLYSNRHVLPCPSWLAWMVELDNPLAKAHKAQSIVDALEITEDMRILDVGCGPGRVTLPLAQKIAAKNGQVTALDIQTEMIEKTKNKAHHQGVTNIDFLHGAVDKIDLNKEYYDAVLLVCMIGEIPESNRLLVLSKIFAALKSGGVLSITETIFDPHFQSSKKMIALMQQAQFKLKKLIGNGLAYTAHFSKE